MKPNKISKLSSLVLLLTAFLTSCDFLDVVPPEQAGLPDATQDANATLGFLYSCYHGVKSEQNTSYTKTTTGASTDEYVLPILWEHGGQKVAWNQDPISGVLDWRWGTYYRFIGQCHLFIRELKNAKGVTEAQKKEWATEANFLIAYYHFCLLRLYGPIPITDTYIDMNTPSGNYNGRFHFDYVADWIVKRLDEVIKDLPPTRENDEWGRATSTIAKAIKARCLLYAASPLWNGKFPYPNWKNKNFETPGYGKELVSLKYDRKKWERAKEACLDALNFAESNGKCELYKDTVRYKQEGLELPFVPGVSARDNSDFLRRVLMFRYLVTTRSNQGNQEIVWGLADDGSIINGSLPHRILKKNDGNWSGGWNGVAPTLFSVEHFYTKNGKLPKYDNNFRPESEWFNSAGIGERNDIINLNVNREPRFYAWLAFDGGDYGGSKFIPSGALKLEMRNGERQGYNPDLYNRDHSATGYLNQKFIQPARGYSVNGGTSGNQSYPQQLIRLAELYLNLAECYAELGDVSNALKYLNVIRERAGIPELTASDINGNMTIVDWVRNERFVELWNEGIRFFDVRRWAEGEKYFSAGKREGLNATSKVNPSFEEFNKRTKIAQPFEWNNRMNLFPIFINEVYKNPQMVQAPGYE